MFSTLRYFYAQYIPHNNDDTQPNNVSHSRQIAHFNVVSYSACNACERRGKTIFNHVMTSNELKRIHLIFYFGTSKRSSTVAIWGEGTVRWQHCRQPGITGQQYSWSLLLNVILFFISLLSIKIQLHEKKASTLKQLAELLRYANCYIARLVCVCVCIQCVL